MNQRTRVDSWVGTYYALFFLLLFVRFIMLNNFVQVIWIDINDKNTHSQSARNRFNQVVKAKRFEGVFLCRKSVLNSSIKL